VGHVFGADVCASACSVHNAATVSANIQMLHLPSLCAGAAANTTSVQGGWCQCTIVRALWPAFSHFVCASAHLELSSLDAIASHSCAQCAPIRRLAIKLTHTCTHGALQRVLNREMEQTREKGTRCAPQHLRTSPQRISHREQFTHALEFRQTMHGWRTWLPCVVRPGGSRQSRR
jgi:hypothetical protein